MPILNPDSINNSGSKRKPAPKPQR